MPRGATGMAAGRAGGRSASLHFRGPLEALYTFAVALARKLILDFALDGIRFGRLLADHLVNEVAAASRK